MSVAGSSWVAGRWEDRWSVSDDDLRRPLAVDDVVPQPRRETTQAATIDASPELGCSLQASAAPDALVTFRMTQSLEWLEASPAG